MNPATQEGTPFQLRSGAHSLRFRDLLHRLFSMANQGCLRQEFLQRAGGSILEFLGCDLLEVRLEEAGKAYRWRSGAAGLDPSAPALVERIIDAVLHGQALAESPFSSRGGSIWTGDASQPIRLRDGARAEGQARSLVIGGEHLALACVPVPVDERRRGVLLLGYRQAGSLGREDVPFLEGLAETLGVAVALQASQWALRERVKELDCLYGIAQITQQPGLPLATQLAGIVGLLPPAWQYPDCTRARIVLDDQEFATPGFGATPWLQEATLRIGDRVRGRVQVAYDRPLPLFDEGPFLREERSLIEEVAHQVGLIVGRHEDALATAKLFHMLEQRRE